jgi:hypothetical protein
MLLEEFADGEEPAEWPLADAEKMQIAEQDAIELHLHQLMTATAQLFLEDCAEMELPTEWPLAEKENSNNAILVATESTDATVLWFLRLCALTWEPALPLAADADTPHNAETDAREPFCHQLTCHNQFLSLPLLINHFLNQFLSLPLLINHNLNQFLSLPLLINQFLNQFPNQFLSLSLLINHNLNQFLNPSHCQFLSLPLLINHNLNQFLNQS